MKRQLLFIMGLGLLLVAEARSQDERKKEDTPKKAQAVKLDENVLKEFTRFQGRWTCEAFEEEGKEWDRKRIRGRTILFGGTHFIAKRGDMLIQHGIQKLDPTKTPKAVDAAILAGDYKNETMKGIYEFEGDTLKVCFDAEGKERPTEFKTRADSSLFLAVYRRDKSSLGDEPDIVGTFHCEGTLIDGGIYTFVVEIQRHGDGYLLRWSKDNVDNYVGMGVRRGNTLSVCWATRTGIGITVYQIEKGPRLLGEWTELGGIGSIQREVLTLVERPK